MVLITSCRIKEKLQLSDRVATVSEEALVSHILENQLNFESLYFKRMNIEFNDNGKSISARANMYIKKDRQIIVQVFVAILEVARVSIKPNEIVVIDRFNKSVYQTDFNYINRRFGLNMNFDMLQSILTNMLFSYPQGAPNAVKHYTTEISNRMYVLRSADNTHEIDVMPDGFKIIRNGIGNSAGTMVDIRYESFTSLNETKFPTLFSISGKRGSQEYALTLKCLDIEINGTAAISFNIPESYDKGAL
ncbi:MAG: DUF4292 domain-containing protein [Cytophagaceae bacterium]|jgi:hypothetical protein|nr:DUF4292 domain-containing protein [Cytophagaceae bacterium]